MTQISDERLAELAGMCEHHEKLIIGVKVLQGSYPDIAAALRELQRLRREASQMTSLAGNALVQLHDAVCKDQR